MKTTGLFENTLEALRERQEHHNAQLGLINLAISSLQSDEGLTYEAHIQTESPDHRSIMAEGRKLGETCERARKLWVEHNKNGKGRYLGRIEVFVCVNGLRMGISPEDASIIAADEHCVGMTADSFDLDRRLSEFPNQMVFNESDTDLPSAWYATSPTPEKSAETVTP